MIVLLLIVEYVLVPQLAGAGETLGLLAHVNTLYVVAGVILEAASLFVYSMLTRTVLPAPNRPPITTLVRIDLTTLGMNHVIPGGGATANALRYQLLTASGVSGADAVFGTVVQGRRLRDRAQRHALAGTDRHDPTLRAEPLLRCVRRVGRRSVRRGGGGRVRPDACGGLDDPAGTCDRRAHSPGQHRWRGTAVRQLAHHLRTFGSDRGLMVRAILRAAVNWLLDAVSLWVFVAAFGYRGRLTGRPTMPGPHDRPKVRTERGIPPPPARIRSGPPRPARTGPIRRSPSQRPTPATALSLHWSTICR